MLRVPLGGRARDWQSEWREEAFSLLQVLGDLGSYWGEMLPSSPQPPSCCYSPPASCVDATAPRKVPNFPSPGLRTSISSAWEAPLLTHSLRVCVCSYYKCWLSTCHCRESSLYKKTIPALTFLCCLEVSPLGTDGSISFSLSFLLIFPK